jgi:hypothetical protein
MKIASVVWKDACHSVDDREISEVSELRTLREVGWLAAETEESITLSIEEPDGTTIRNWMTIPRSAIVSMRTFPVSRFFPEGRKRK